APEQTLLDPALDLHVVLDGRLDHDHATGVDDQCLAVDEVEVEEIAAAVKPDGPRAFQALEEEAFAAAGDPHPHPFGERALDRHIANVAEVRVFLADDFAVELVLADRARERTADSDRAAASCGVRRQEQTLAREHRALHAAHEPARHFDVHLDVTRD